VIVLETLARRWYVVAFVVLYFAASVPERGWPATIRFYAIATVVAFAAELSSTRNGFPFSDYAYTEATRGEELYLSNIPAFVPFSYAVMIYAGRSLGARLARAAGGLRLVIAGALATMAIDVVVDPIAVRGEHWFLGDLFAYAEGDFFGVSFGNFAGWVLVAAVVIALDLTLGGRRETELSRRGVGLAAVVIAFNAAIGLWIGAPLAVFASLAVMLALFAMIRLLPAPKIGGPA
jgi:uncharacterized membrane protein